MGGTPLIKHIAYALLGFLAAVWIASLGWGLRRLGREAPAHSGTAHRARPAAA